MIRCFADASQWEEATVTLSSREMHHLVHVLRLKTGDSVTVLDGRGREGTARLKMDAGHHAVLEITHVVKRPPPVISIILFQAIPKAQRMDLIMQKATELNVAKVVPMITERTIVHLAPDQYQTRCDRWRRIAVDAAKQCGAAWIPEITSIMDYRNALEICADLDLCLIASLQKTASAIRDVLSSAKQAGPQTVGCVIGPEGDLTSDEICAATDTGALEVNLGKSILRTETAALYVLSILCYEFNALEATGP